MNIGKKILAAILTIAVLINSLLFSFASDVLRAEGNAYYDVVQSHWAYHVITKWSGGGYNVLQGDGAGGFAPDRGVSLAELATVLTKIFGYTDRISSNVEPDWAREYVEKAMAAGVIAPASFADANTKMTREQAVKCIALAYGVEPVIGNTSFSDDHYIAPEYKPYVNAFQIKGYVTGKGGNIFDPQAEYTRAEAMQLLENTTNDIIGASVFNMAYQKLLIVRKSGVEIGNTVIGADLIIGQGAAGGQVVLDDVSLGGRLIIYGGEVSIRNSAIGAAIISGENIKLEIGDGAYVGAATIAGAGATVCGEGEINSVSLTQSNLDTAKILIESQIQIIERDDQNNPYTDPEIKYDNNNEYQTSASTDYRALESYGLSGIFTRGEWAFALSDKLNLYLPDDINSVNCYYGDTYRHKYGLHIEAMKAYGYLPYPDLTTVPDEYPDFPLYRPDEPITREFAAYTVVKSLGYIWTSEKLYCSDLASVNYLQECAIAVKQGYLDCGGERFNPDGALSAQETEKLLKALDCEILGGPRIKEQIEEVSYTDGLIKNELIDYVNYEYIVGNDGSILLYIESNEILANIIPGDVFVLPPNGEHITGVALKAAAPPTIENGKLKLICDIPELSEIYTSVHFSGYGNVDINNLVLAEGVTAKLLYDDMQNGGAPVYPISYKSQGRSFAPSAIEFNLGNIPANKLKISGKITCGKPEVICEANIKKGILFGLDINEFEISIKNDIKIEADFQYAGLGDLYNMEGGNGANDLAPSKYFISKLPVPLGATGLSVDLAFYLSAGITGGLKLSYEIVATNGLELKNGSLKTINDVTNKDANNKYPNMTIYGSAKAGATVAAQLDAFEVINLVGIDVNAGLGLNAKYTPHPLGASTVNCSDVTFFPYISLGIDMGSCLGMMIKEVYKGSYAWDIWNESTSPYKAIFHFENGKGKDKCTFGYGGVSGYIKNVAGEALYSSKLTLIKDNKIVKVIYPEKDGLYKLSGVIIGNYILDVSAPGYKAQSTGVAVKKDNIEKVDINLTASPDTQINRGNIKAEIKDAVTGAALSAVTYDVRVGKDNVTGPVILTGKAVNGKISLDMTAGEYTVMFKCDKYISHFANFTFVDRYYETKNVALAPIEKTLSKSGGDILRVVMEWGDEPYDLDSHLVGPSEDGGKFHIHPVGSNKVYSLSGMEFAKIDIDAMNGRGPETTTVYKINKNGTYSFYVQDFTNKDKNDSMALSASGAQVRVYSGSLLLSSYNVPTQAAGNYWYVFDYYPGSDTLLAVNTLSNINPSELMF